MRHAARPPAQGTCNPHTEAGSPQVAAVDTRQTALGETCLESQGNLVEEWGLESELVVSFATMVVRH